MDLDGLKLFLLVINQDNEQKVVDNNIHLPCNVVAINASLTLPVACERHYVQLVLGRIIEADSRTLAPGVDQALIEDLNVRAIAVSIFEVGELLCKGVSILAVYQYHLIGHNRAVLGVVTQVLDATYRKTERWYYTIHRYLCSETVFKSYLSIRSFKDQEC